MDRFDTFLSELIPAGVALGLMANLTLTALGVVLVSLVLVLFLRRASASARHFVLALAFVGMLAVPVLSFLLPSRPDSRFVDTIPETVQTQAERLGDATALETSGSINPLPEPAQAPLPNDELERAFESETPPHERRTPEKSEINASVTGHKEPDAAESMSAGWFDGVTLRHVEIFVTLLWGAGVLLLALRVMRGQVILLRILRSGRQISDSHVAGTVRDALAAVGLQRPVALIESDHCSMPMTCGWMRPSVVLPTAAREWSADRLRMVLVHELAHVKRRDCLWQWLVFVVTACNWFNPLVWLTAARLRSEQEQACDDAVLNTGVRASDYAETLLDLSTGGRRNLLELYSGIAMARSDRLSSRVRAIVDEQRDRQAVSPKACVMACLVAMLLVVPLSQFAQASFQVGAESAPRNDRPKPPEAPASRDAAAPEETDARKASRQRNPEEQIMITLPGGHMLGTSQEHDALVESALALLNSTRSEGRYNGQHDTSLGLLFSPPREIPLSYGGLERSKHQTVRISRLYIDVRNVLGPGDIVAEIDGAYRSVTQHQLREWVAFRRELDRLTFRRPRPIVPAVGEWSKAVNGLKARLAVDNWRDPMIGVFLELKNVKDLVNTITVPLDADDIHFELRDQDGEGIPDAGQPRSGPVAELKDFRLPFDSSLKFNLSVSTVGVVTSDNAMIALRSHSWRIPPGDFNAYQLSASFAVKHDLKENQTVWHGELQVPPVTIQPAPRQRVPDRIVSRSYNIDADKRPATLEALAAIFKSEEDVSFKAGREPAQIEVTAAESRHGFISDLVAVLKSDNAGDVLPPEGRVGLGTIKEIADALAAVFPDWGLHDVDSKPRALADGYRGFRIVLRRTWKESIGLPQQRAQPAGESTGPFEERHEDWEFVLVPVQPAKAPESFKSRLDWQASTSPYHTRDICLGEGHGYMWFTHGTIPLQHGVRERLELKGGDDPIQLAADGLLIEDTGTNTANSARWLLAPYGDRALPYIERAIQKAQKAGEDPWKAVVSLSQIQTPRATDMLIRLFESSDDKLRRPAGYALIHKPYRKSAKRAYLAMLRDRVSVERVAEACVEFEWTEAIPILQNLIDKPNNLREFQYALHARRSLEGRPIAQEVLDAEQMLRSVTGGDVDPQHERQIASARQLLIGSEDSEAANLAALSLAVFVTKGDVSKVREAGIKILRLRPREETLKFLQTLATGIHEDKRIQIENVLRTVSN